MKINFRIPTPIMRFIRVGLATGIGAGFALYAENPWIAAVIPVLNMLGKSAREHFHNQGKDHPWYAGIF